MIEYADASYMPQLMALSHKAITDIFQEELHRKNQIKSAIVVNANYVIYNI